MNAAINLSTPNFGPMIANELIESGDLLALSKAEIKPFYQRKMEHAISVIRKNFSNID